MKARVATIAVLACAGLASADEGASKKTAFSRTGLNTPRLTYWTGAEWGSSSATAQLQNVPSWIVVRDCPTGDEFVMASIDPDNDVAVTFQTTGGFTAPIEVTASGASYTQRAFDVAYEQLTGDALVVYWIADPLGMSSGLGYRTAHNGVMSAQSRLSIITSGLTNVRLYPRAGSDQILMLGLSSSSSLVGSVWNGSSWGAVSTVALGVASSTKPCFDAAWETVNGRAVIVYGKQGSRKPSFRLYSSAGFSAEAAMADVGGVPQFVRLAPSPMGSNIIFGTETSAGAIAFSTWNGGEWSPAFTAETSVRDTLVRHFDVSYQPDGSKALAVYARNGDTRLIYRSWNGSAWSGAAYGPDLGDNPMSIQLSYDSAGAGIFVLAADEGRDLSATTWNGTALSAAAELETDRGADVATEPFMVMPPIPPVRRLKIVAWNQRSPNESTTIAELTLTGAGGMTGTTNGNGHLPEWLEDLLNLRLGK